MRRMTLAAAIAALFLSLGVHAAPAIAGDEKAAKPVTNKVCPIMGSAVNAKVRTEHDGQYVYFCCAGCIDAFKADPDAAIAKMSDEDRAAVQKNTTCAVTDEPISSFDTRTEHDGRWVYFCCPGCKTMFDKKNAPAAD